MEDVTDHTLLMNAPSATMHMEESTEIDPSSSENTSTVDVVSSGAILETPTSSTNSSQNEEGISQEAETIHAGITIDEVRGQLETSSSPESKPDGMSEHGTQGSQSRRSTRSMGRIETPPLAEDVEDEAEEEEEEEDEATELRELIETLLERVESRWSVADDGDPGAFPKEGLCFVALRLEAPPKYKGESAEVRVVLWPAWLLAPLKVPEIATQVERIEVVDGASRAGLAPEGGDARTVCCYGDGRFLRVRGSLLLPFDNARARGTSRGGLLWATALRQAEARRDCPADFVTMVSQNLDLCASPALLGRLWRAQQERAQKQRRPCRHDIVAVKWNTCDWWPAKIVAVASDGSSVEVEYKDEDRTRLEMNWPEEDAFLLNDSEAVEYDSDDAELLDDASLCGPPEVSSFVEGELELVETVESDDKSGSRTAKSARSRGQPNGENGSSSVGSLKVKLDAGTMDVAGDHGGQSEAKKAKKRKDAASDKKPGSPSVEKADVAAKKSKPEGNTSAAAGPASKPRTPGGSSTTVSSPAGGAGLSVLERARVEAKAQADAVRKGVRQRLQGVLVLDTPEAQRAGGGLATLDPAILAAGIEREIFGQTRADDTAENRGVADLVGDAYKRKLRMLAFNLRKNISLRARVCTGQLLPAALVSLGADDLAPEDVAKEREAARQRELYNRHTAVTSATEAALAMVSSAGSEGRSPAAPASTAGPGSAPRAAAGFVAPAGPNVAAAAALVSKGRREALDITALLDSALVGPKPPRRTMVLEASRPVGGQSSARSSTVADSNAVKRAGVGKLRRVGETLGKALPPSVGPLPSLEDVAEANGIVPSRASSRERAAPVLNAVATIPPPLPPDPDDEPYDPDDDVVIDPSILRDHAAAAVSQKSAVPAPTMTLPAGWIARYSQRKRAWYYVEEVTGESRWDPPPLFKGQTASTTVSTNSATSNAAAVPLSNEVSRVVSFSPVLTTATLSAPPLSSSMPVDPKQALQKSDRIALEDPIRLLEAAIADGDLEAIRASVLEDEMSLRTLVGWDEATLVTVENIISRVHGDFMRVGIYKTEQERQRELDSDRRDKERDRELERLQRISEEQRKAAVEAELKLLALEERERERSLREAKERELLEFKEKELRDLKEKERERSEREKKMERDQLAERERERDPRAREREEGSWSCPDCGNRNFSTRQTCNRKNCNTPKPLFKKDDLGMVDPLISQRESSRYSAQKDNASSGLSEKRDDARSPSSRDDSRSAREGQHHSSREAGPRGGMRETPVARDSSRQDSEEPVSRRPGSPRDSSRVGPREPARDGNRNRDPDRDSQVDSRDLREKRSPNPEEKPREQSRENHKEGPRPDQRDLLSRERRPDERTQFNRPDRAREYESRAPDEQQVKVDAASTSVRAQPYSTTPFLSAPAAQPRDLRPGEKLVPPPPPPREQRRDYVGSTVAPPSVPPQAQQQSGKPASGPPSPWAIPLQSAMAAADIEGVRAILGANPSLLDSLARAGSSDAERKANEHLLLQLERMIMAVPPELFSQPVGASTSGNTPGTAPLSRRSRWDHSTTGFEVTEPAPAGRMGQAHASTPEAPLVRQPAYEAHAAQRPQPMSSFSASLPTGQLIRDGGLHMAHALKGSNGHDFFATQEGPYAGPRHGPPQVPLPPPPRPPPDYPWAHDRGNPSSVPFQPTPPSAPPPYQNQILPRPPMVPHPSEQRGLVPPPLGISRDANIWPHAQSSSIGMAPRPAINSEQIRIPQASQYQAAPPQIVAPPGMGWIDPSSRQFEPRTLPAGSQFPVTNARSEPRAVKNSCHKFNNKSGCAIELCRFQHVCEQCGSRMHGSFGCESTGVCRKFAAGECDSEYCRFPHVCELCGSSAHGSSHCGAPAIR